MEISELALKLTILLIPGFVASWIIEKLVSHKEWELPRFILYSILLAVSSYLLAQLPFAICSSNDEFTIWKDILDAKKIPYKEIVYGCIASVFLGATVSLLDKYMVILRIGRKLRLTQKYGDSSAFMYYLNQKGIEWVHVRDCKTSITFRGMVSAYNETNDVKEIVLLNVTAYYSENSEPLYTTRSLFLSRSKDDIHIEDAYEIEDANPVNNKQIKDTENAEANK